MATSAQTQINRVRTFIRDWPAIQDVLTAACSTTSTTSLTVADATLYPVRSVIQIDQEAMYVTAAPAGTTLTVTRGVRGTTAATHANGATVLIQPRFLDFEILDAFNQGLDACYPYIYKEVLDSSLAVVSNQYEYTVPNLPSTSVPIPRIWKVEVLMPGDASYRKVEDWTIAKGATPKLKFRDVPYPGSTIRLRGYGPFAHLAATDSMDVQWPSSADLLPRLYASSELLASGEAGRVRVSSGAVDAREQANRTGSSTAAGRDTLSRFQALLLNGGHMAPMQAHIVVTY